MNRSIPDEIIHEVRSRSNIIETLSGFGVHLKKSGSASWKACCPFHNEKTPSFTVNETTQRYKCFGCGKGGDVFRFVMEHQSVDFPHAIHILAERCGVVIPEKSSFSPEEDARNREKRNKRERLLEISAEFAKWYSSLLWSNQNSPVGRYFQRRRIPREVAEAFQIGAVPDGWDNSLKYGLSKGFTEEEMLDAGILKLHEEKQSVYDRFRNRLVFTIWNEQGKPVGFSGRAIEPDQIPKYLNSPETPIFHKGSILYALPLARRQIHEKGFAILCEGQIDTVAMHCAGFLNTVATQGTAFGEEHARMLKRYCDRVLLAMDSDNAGQEAILKAIKILLPLDFEVQIIRWPGGKDPDELYQNEGAGHIAEQVAGAIDFFDFVWARLEVQFDQSQPFGRQNAAAAALEYLTLISAPVARELYIRKLAQCVKVPEAVIARQMGEVMGKSSFHQPPAIAADMVIIQEETGDDCPTEVAHAEEILLSLTLADLALAQRLGELFTPDMFSTTMVGQALNIVISLAGEGGWEKRFDILSDMEDEREQEDARLGRILVQEAAVPEEKIEKAVADTVSVIKRFKLEKRLNEIKQKMQNLIDQEERKSLLKEYLELSQQKL